ICNSFLLNYVMFTDELSLNAIYTEGYSTLVAGMSCDLWVADSIVDSTAR
ncbi:unnamed protein product, partial [marine sediment metagenome]